MMIPIRGLVAVLWLFTAWGDLRPGAPGGALNFERPSDIVATLLHAPPSDAMTMECWVRPSDPHVFLHYLFGIATYDEATDTETPKELALAVSGPHGSGAFVARSASNYFRDCSNCTVDVTRWNHVALTWSTANGTELFLDGTSRATSSAWGDFASPFPSNSTTVLVLGHGMLGFASLFSNKARLRGLLDDFRLWDHVRSPGEIAANRHTVPPAGSSGLLVSYDFDDYDPTVGVILDHSGLGQHAQAGWLPDAKRRMTFTDHATLTAGSPAVVQPGTDAVPLAHAARADGVHFVAPDHEGDGTPLALLVVPAYGDPAPVGGGWGWYLQSLPAEGEIWSWNGTHRVAQLGVNDSQPVLTLGREMLDTMQADPGLACTMIRFVNTSAVPPAGLSFTWRAEALGDPATWTTGVVWLLPLVLEDPQDERLELLEDDHAVGLLGNIAPDGEATQVWLTALPAPEAGLVGVVPVNITNIDIDTNLDRLEPVGSVVPALVEDLHGLVVFRPEPLVFGTGVANFTYERRHKGLVTGSATVTLDVLHVNHAPVVQPLQLATAEGERVLLVQLTATDVDDTFSNGSHTFAVSDFPAVGRLLQYEAGGTPGAEIAAASALESFQWASSVLNGSSQWSFCTPCLPDVLCGGEGFDACYSVGWMAAAAVGEPDVYPGYGDLPLSWQPLAQDNAFEFGEFAFEHAVYINSVAVYETFTPGGVVRILTASEWDGPRTDWTVVWQGRDTEAPSGESWIFAPPLCPPTRATRFLRLEMDHSLHPGWSNYDAIQIRGSAAPPRGTLSDPKGRLFYEAPHGQFQGAQSSNPFDSFTARATDCLDLSVPASVEISHQAPDGAGVGVGVDVEPSIRRNFVRATTPGGVVTIAIGEALLALAQQVRLPPLIGPGSSEAVAWHAAIAQRLTLRSTGVSGPGAAGLELVWPNASFLELHPNNTRAAALGSVQLDLWWHDPAEERDLLVRLGVQVDCAALGAWPVDESEDQCRSCDSVGEDAVEAMSVTEARIFDVACPTLIPGSTLPMTRDVPLLFLAGVIGSVGACTSLALVDAAAYRKSPSLFRALAGGVLGVGSWGVNFAGFCSRTLGTLHHPVPTYFHPGWLFAGLGLGAGLGAASFVLLGRAQFSRPKNPASRYSTRQSSDRSPGSRHRSRTLSSSTQRSRAGTLDDLRRNDASTRSPNLSGLSSRINIIDEHTEYPEAKEEEGRRDRGWKPDLSLDTSTNSRAPPETESPSISNPIAPRVRPTRPRLDGRRCRGQCPTNPWRAALGGVVGMTALHMNVWVAGLAWGGEFVVEWNAAPVASSLALAVLLGTPALLMLLHGKGRTRWAGCILAALVPFCAHLLGVVGVVPLYDPSTTGHGLDWSSLTVTLLTAGLAGVLSFCAFGLVSFSMRTNVGTLTQLLSGSRREKVRADHRCTALLHQVQLAAEAFTSALETPASCSAYARGLRPLLVPPKGRRDRHTVQPSEEDLAQALAQLVERAATAKIVSSAQLPSLQEMLRHPLVVQLFTEHSRASFTRDKVLFLLAVEDFAQTKDAAARLPKSRSVMHDFIDDDSGSTQMNISARARKTLVALKEAGRAPVTMFDSVRDEVAKLARNQIEEFFVTPGGLLAMVLLKEREIMPGWSVAIRSKRYQAHVEAEEDRERKTKVELPEDDRSLSLSRAPGDSKQTSTMIELL